MKKAWEIENPVALVYRARYGCSKQYVFESADDLETWAARKAYCGEFVTVIAIRDERCLDPKTLPVSDAAKWVREAVSANNPIRQTNTGREARYLVASKALLGEIGEK